MCFLKKMCQEASEATFYSYEKSQKCVIECMKFFMLIWSPWDDQDCTMERAAQAVHRGNISNPGSWSEVNNETKTKYREVAKIVMKFFINKLRE